MKLQLDHTHLMAPNIGSSGVSPAAFDQHHASRDAAADAVLARSGDDLGFLTLPETDAHARAVEAILHERRTTPRSLLVLGIGGSSLGPRALTDALGPERSGMALGSVHHVDNADPRTLHRALSALDPQTTLVNVISKSGGTVETLAIYQRVLDWLQAAPGGAEGRVIHTTDPLGGFLREQAETRGIDTLSIPASVGGRFSVFTPVGLLPARFAGLDMQALLSGARMALEDGRSRRGDSLAARCASLHHLLTTEQGLPITAWMPYADALATVGAWFVQLWAESLGKPEITAPTPLRAVGATDQHSQLQLWMEGPRDKHIWFVEVDEFDHDDPIRVETPARNDLGHLDGKPLGALLHAERRATALALAEVGVPNATLRLPRIDEESLGCLLMTLQLQTAIAGELWGIDAFNQPGVEAGKRFIHGLMGRADHASERARLEASEAAMTPFKHS